MPKPSTAPNPKVDAYIAKAAPFAQPILEHIRETFHEAAPGVVEEIKWSMPFFVLNGIAIGNMAAFKAHCSLGLWGSAVVKTLREDGVAIGGNMGSFGRITSINNLPPRKRLLAYIHLAAQQVATGKRTTNYTRPRVAKPVPVVPAILATALRGNKAAATRFAAATPGYRREYCDWIADAKREETQQKRIASALEWIAEGKTRNWKYEQRT